METLHYFSHFFFFLQAKDGIRDVAVTGVQTCALPISVYDTSWHMGTVLGQPDGDRRYVAYTVLRDSKGVLRTALGFEAKPTALKPLVVQATEKFALLPRPLTGGVQYDSMGSIIITDRDGVEIYRSAVQYTSPFTARDTIGTDMGDLYAQATLREIGRAHV